MQNRTAIDETILMKSVENAEPTEEFIEYQNQVKA